MSTCKSNALQRKRKYSTLNILLSDEALLKHITKYETGDVEPLLTVGTALLRDDWPPRFTPAGLLHALEENLSLFVPHLNEKQRSCLAANLLNGRVQFLNTVSELGLARHYLERAWEVRLAEPLPCGKDVDLYMISGGETRWLDVINAAPNEWEGDGFSPLLPVDFEMHLVDKVTDKFQSKFCKAIYAGWVGAPWVALDFTKNDAISVAVTLQERIGSNTLAGFAGVVLQQCPKLAGVIYYTYYANQPKAFWVREFKRPICTTK